MDTNQILQSIAERLTPFSVNVLSIAVVFVVVVSAVLAFMEFRELRAMTRKNFKIAILSLQKNAKVMKSESQTFLEQVERWPDDVPFKQKALDDLKPIQAKIEAFEECVNEIGEELIN